MPPVQSDPIQSGPVRSGPPHGFIWTLAPIARPQLSERFAFTICERSIAPISPLQCTSGPGWTCRHTGRLRHPPKDFSCSKPTCHALVDRSNNAEPRRGATSATRSQRRLVLFYARPCKLGVDFLPVQNGLGLCLFCSLQSEPPPIPLTETRLHPTTSPPASFPARAEGRAALQRPAWWMSVRTARSLFPCRDQPTLRHS